MRHSDRISRAVVELRPLADAAGATVEAARYAKDRLLLRPAKESNGLKSRLARILRAHGMSARYTNRERGYVVSVSTAQRALQLHADGWDAGYFRGGELQPPNHPERLTPR